jgi:hypothetical protein
MSPRGPIPVFTWNGDLEVDENDDDAQRLTAGMARIPSEHIRAALLEGDLKVSFPFRDNEHGGFHMDVEFDGATYALFVMWTGIGGPSDNYFAVQSDTKRGIWATLFGRPVPDQELSEISAVLSTALARINQIENLLWLTSQEFQASYCDGAPLPSTGT